MAAALKSSRLINNVVTLAKISKQVCKNQRLIKELGTLVERFLAGNTNVGKGMKYLFNGIYELKGYNAAKVYYRVKNGVIEILAESDKDTQDKVIKILKGIYGK